MKNFIFDLQRFSTVTISSGGTQTFDGVTYKAVEDAQLNLDNDNKISGIASGKVQATVADLENSPIVTFDATNNAFNFTATSDGKVISITPFPIEFISGTFTYNGSRIDITAGSDLAIVTERGGYSLRNENHFVADSAYIFSTTALTSESEHVISKFSLTNGTETRELNLEQLGTVINHFDQQGATLVKGSSEVLNIGNYKLTATAANADAGLNFELGEAGMTLVPNTGDGTLNVALSRNDKTIFGGELECTKGSITFGYDKAVTFAKDTSFNFTTPNNTVLTVTANGEATTAIALTDNGITFTPGTGDGGLDISLSKKGKQVFEGSLNITNGTITFDTDTKKFSFSDGTKISLGIWNLELDIEIVGNTTVGSSIGSNFKIDFDDNGNFIFTPDENGGSFNIALKRILQNALMMSDYSADDDEAFFENNVTVNGPIMFNPQTRLLTLLDGTEVSLKFDNYTLKATADGDASSTISLTEEGISITPETGDGKLKLTLGSANGSMSVDLEVLSGGFLFGEDGALNVVKDTELQIKFSDDYSVSFKTTDAAGGTLRLGSDGITFTPGSDDGKLELTVTRGEETRTASLDVTGSITYKLDGSISLTKGTVVKNVFEDGNILTITANTDASGSIIFNPSTGLQITPSTANALTVALETDGLEVAKFSSITGTFTYSGGIVTASDGSEADLLIYGNDDWASHLSVDGGTASLEFTAEKTVYTANDNATFVLKYDADGSTLQVQNGSFSDIYATEDSDAIELISAGSTFKCNDEEFVFTLESAGDYNLNGMNVTTTADNVEVQLVNDDTIIVNGIFYTPLDDDVKLTIDGDISTVEGGKVSLQMDGFSKVAGFDTTDGSISYDSSSGKFTIANGTKSYFGNGAFPDQFIAQSDFDITVTKNSDGTLTFTADEKAALAIERNGKIVMSTEVTIDGSIIIDPTNNQITLSKGTVLTLTPSNGKILEIKALDDAGGQLSLVEGGLRFAPNDNDGALEFNFVNSGRKVQLDVTGAFIYKGLGALELENGTEATFTWEDGNILKLTSSGSTGSIGLDPELGIKITSDDDNLDMTLTTSYMSTDISGIKGTIYYNAGTVTFAENSKITATTTLGGQPILMTLETIDGTGHISFSETQNGIVYSADTGAMQITWTNADDLESTFTINSGSIQIGHGLFKIAEGTDLATDLKDFIPALNFTTSEAGTYTINGQKITTSAANLALTATDDYMSFKTSDDVVTYDGMTFAGAGNVSLKPDIVVLGAGVEATGFKEGNTFMLAEAGNVTADNKIFTLEEAYLEKDGEQILIPMNVSVEGVTDGFIFSRTLTEESEEAIEADPPMVGSIFTEKFIVHGDDSYQVVTDAIGLEKVIGISKNSTVEGGATLDDEDTLSYYVLKTDTNGDFTIGENTYTIAEDSTVGTELRAHFEDSLAYVDKVNELNGTISGNFTDGAVSINGSASAVQSVDDTLISIAADTSGFSISGLDDSELLRVSAKDTYVVNNTTINANAGDFIAGNDNAAYLLAMNDNTVVTGTESDDMIANNGTNVTINALGGSDTVMNYVADSVKVNAGAGYDYIVNNGSAVTIDAAEDNDIVFNIARVDSETDEVISSPDNVSISGGDGDDFIAADGSNVTIQGGAGNDSVATDGESASIDAGAGNDNIEINGDNTSVNAGDGSNQITISGKNEVILLKGRTTVEGFNTGFGDGSDTIYIEPENDPAGVEFLEDGLTFGNNTASLTLGDVNTTAKVNLFHENRDVLNKGVFIAAGDWYKAEDSDLTVNAGEEVYFVGTAADPSAGVDFSGISSDLNVTMDTEWEIPDNTMWVNGIYSLKGGTGNSTITGSDKSDTVISGTGETTINAAKGDDLISLSGGSALIQYATGDGNDTVIGFDSNATLSPDGTYTTQVSGDDLIVNVGESKITLKDAANLSYPNIASSNPLVQLVETILKRTPLGYPAMAAAVFNPEGNYGDEPTNYSAKEDWTITSADKLKLHAVHYTPENSNNKWVVLIHGYGNNHTAMYTYAESYLANNYNVLMIDQRAAGESEGTWLTMGAAESADVALWTKEIARRNSNAKITLHGVSMGAATAMLAAARSDTKNVTSVVEDCGYSDIMETFSTIIANTPELGISPEVVPYLDPVAADLTGYYLHDAAPIDSISSVKMPSLFISGDADTVAPVTMLEELYDVSGAEVKEKFIVEGTKHALAVFDDSIGYNNAVFRFVAEADGEGWVTENTTDEISLRGTKYGDTITNSGDDVTINAGKGNDSITGTGENVRFDYTAGDGNDTIYGFNETDTLSISGADYTPIKSGNDIIVTVDEGKITLVDAASLSSTFNIVDENGVTTNLISNSTNDNLVTGTDEADCIFNDATSVTIQGRGGDDYIENSVDSSLTAATLGNLIDAGAGNDTVYNYHTYNPSIYGGDGNDSIFVSRGHNTYIEGGAGNDTIIGKKDRGGWAMGGHATILGGDGNDYIDTGYSNDSAIDGGNGNDTIKTSGTNSTIDGGEGKNVISMSGGSEFVVLNGNTTVKGFKAGFGSGSDTVYIEGISPAVDFKKEGLTLYYDDDKTKSLTFADRKNTTKLNLYYEASLKTVSEVFIADDEWYKVTEKDLSTMDNSELRFVGATAKKNHGIDFSGIESDLNVSLLGHNYPEEVENLFINNIHSIKGGAGKSTITGSDTSDTIIGGTGETTINAAKGDDLISLSSGSALIQYTLGDGNDSIVGFKANSTLSISGGKYSLETQDDKSILHIGDEKITIFGANNGNIIGQRDIPVEELESVYGDKLTVANSSPIELAPGAAVAVYDDKYSGAVDILGSADADTLIALDSAPVTFDMSAGGADKIPLLMANQNVTLENYNPVQGGGIATGNPNRSSMVEDIMAGKDTRFGNGNVSLKTSEETQSVFTLANTNPTEASIINFLDANNNILPVGFTNEFGGTVDVSDSDDDYLLLGNYFADKNRGSTLLGGNGNDTLLGGKGDLLDGEGGMNQIYLAGGGAKIGLDNGGRTTVHNFQTGFDDGDALYSAGDIAARIRFDGEKITASIDGGAKVKLESVAGDADFAELLMYEGEDLTRIAVAKPGGMIKSHSADIYLGRENAGVDFSGMTDDLLVDLSDEPVETGSDQKQFFGIKQVIAGDGNSTLIGTSGNETLTAGKGNTSIHGGAGNDSLIGKGGSSDKTGSTTFFFDAGDGRDLIKDFDFLTADNSDTADKIDIGENVIKDASISRGKVFVDFEDGSRLVIRDAVGKDFRIGDLVAKVDSNISYDGLANCYVVSGGSSLTVDSTVESAEIWLDNSHDTLFFGNIRTLDASAVKGNTSLVGNEFNNTIIAGQGDSSLWGGSSASNDLLIGGAGKNTFFYLQGDGRDTIQGVNNGDEIILDNINLDQIISADISATGVVLNFDDGGSLTIDGTADVTYQLADGSKYSANHESLEWIDR